MELELYARDLRGGSIAPSPLAKKMRLDGAKNVSIVNAPEGYLKLLQPFPADLKVSDNLSGKFDWIQVFVRTKAEFEALMPKALKAMASESRMWITFPKVAPRYKPT